MCQVNVVFYICKVVADHRSVSNDYVCKIMEFNKTEISNCTLK